VRVRRALALGTLALVGVSAAASAGAPDLPSEATPVDDVLGVDDVVALLATDEAVLAGTTSGVWALEGVVWRRVRQSDRCAPDAEAIAVLADAVDVLVVVDGDPTLVSLASERAAAWVDGCWVSVETPRSPEIAVPTTGWEMGDDVITNSETDESIEVDVGRLEVIAVDSEGTVWVGGSDRVQRVRAEDRVVSGLGEIVDVVADGYVLTDSALWQRVDSEWQSSSPCDPDAVLGKVAAMLGDRPVVAAREPASTLLIDAGAGCLETVVIDGPGAEIVDVAVWGDAVLVATENGLVSVDGNLSSTSVCSSVPPDATDIAVGDGVVWIGTEAGASRLDLSTCELSMLFDGLTIWSVSGGSMPLFAGNDHVVDEDGATVAELEGATLAAGPDGRVWAAHDDGLTVIETSTGRVGATMRGRYAGPVSVVAEGDGTVSWAALEDGLAIDHDKGRAPTFLDVSWTCDGRPCTVGDAPFDTRIIEADLAVSDLADLGATVELSVTRRGDAVPTEGLAFAVQEGGRYEVTATLFDAHLNTVTLEPFTVEVGSRSVGDRARELGGNPLAYVLAILLAGAGVVLFVGWRRAGRVRVRSASVHLDVDPIDAESVVVTTRIDRSLLGLRLASEGVVHRIHRDEVVDAAALVGGDGLRALARRLDAPTTRLLRLTVSAASPAAGVARGVSWEAIGDARGALTARGLVPVRSVRPGTAQQRGNVLRVLIARSQPTDQAALDGFDAQVDAVRRCFPDSTIEVHDDDLDIDGLVEVLGTQEWDVIHLYAHGGWRDSGGHLLWRDGSGTSVRVLADDFADFVAGRPLLAVFAACRTTNPDRDTGEVIGLAESATVWADHAIGFADEVAQSALCEFSTAFYDRLRIGRQVDVAVAAGRAAITSGDHDRSLLRHCAGPTDGSLYTRRSS
jgi:hypothetical protein